MGEGLEVVAGLCAVAVLGLKPSDFWGVGRALSMVLLGDGVVAEVLKKPSREEFGCRSW